MVRQDGGRASHLDPVPLARRRGFLFDLLHQGGDASSIGRREIAVD
jgi:hypothetical protein